MEQQSTTQTYKEEYFCYINSENKNVIIFSLLSSSLLFYKDTYMIKEFEVYKRMIKEMSPINPLNSKYSENYIYDKIKLSIMFENFLKAYFLSKNYIIHKYKDNKKKPINISDINHAIVKHENIASHPDIKYHTLGFKDLVSNDYKKVLIVNGISEEIISIFTETQQVRNTIHFYTCNIAKFGSDDLSKLNIINDFVNNSIIILYNNVKNKINHLKNKYPENQIDLDFS